MEVWGTDEEEPNMTLPKIRFTWDINFGAVAQMITVATFALGLYAVGLRFQWTTEAGLAEAAAARAKYIPIIDSLTKSDDTQNFRLEATSTAIQDLRRLSIDNSQ